MGSVLRMPFLYTEDFTAVCKRLGREGVRLFAAHLKGMNNYDRQDYTGNVGFLIGNEANGLTCLLYTSWGCRESHGTVFVIRIPEG